MAYRFSDYSSPDFNCILYGKSSEPSGDHQQEYDNVERISVFAFALGLATLVFSFAPYHCSAPLLPNGQGWCSGHNIPFIGDTPVPSLTSLGLFFCAMEMANKTLRKRSRELKDERNNRNRNLR